MENATTNRMFKNSVFTKLFGEKERLLELYNAIENTNYASDTDIRITTLENVLVNGMPNDISFVIDGKIENLYRRKAISIPKPEFIVLYNGSDEFPDQKTLKLSDILYLW
jgi:hypothetical protein